MELERPLPQPITPEAKPYWEGLREQKLMLPRCRACRRAFFYPRVLCPHCHGTRVVTTDGRDAPCEECGGRGEIHCCEGLQEQPGTRGSPRTRGSDSQLGMQLSRRIELRQDPLNYCGVSKFLGGLHP